MDDEYPYDQHLSAQTIALTSHEPDFWYCKLPYWSPEDLVDYIACLNNTIMYYRHRIGLTAVEVQGVLRTQATLTALREIYTEPTITCPSCKSEQEIVDQGSSPSFGGTTAYWTNLACGHGLMEETPYTDM